MNACRPSKKTPTSRYLILALLILTLTLALASCSFALGKDPSDSGESTTAVRGGATLSPQATVTFVQYASPEIPADAGSYAYVAEHSLASVVSIMTESTVYNSFYGSYVESGAGSGVILSSEAEGGSYIITNNHVIEGCSAIKVYTNDADCPGYTATLVGTDWQSDIAVLWIEEAGLTPAVIGNSTELVAGQEVAAIGNPLGILGGTITDGIISFLERPVVIEGVSMVLLQHSAGVNPGNSGGGLFNMYGQLIGIVNAKSSGDSVEALGYAIPIDLAIERAEQIIAQGYVSNTPYLGISYTSATASGLVVKSYLYNDELSASGQDTIGAGDILHSLDGRAITDVADIREVLSSVKVGDTVSATLYRRVGYSTLRYTVTLTIHEYIPEEASTVPPVTTAPDDSMTFE